MNVGGQYKFSKNQFIGLDIGLVKVNDFVADPVGSKDYTEIKGKIKYKYTSKILMKNFWFMPILLSKTKKSTVNKEYCFPIVML